MLEAAGGGCWRVGRGSFNRSCKQGASAPWEVIQPAAACFVPLLAAALFRLTCSWSSKRAALPLLCAAIQNLRLSLEHGTRRQRVPRDANQGR